MVTAPLRRAGVGLAAVLATVCLTGCSMLPAPLGANAAPTQPVAPSAAPPAAAPPAKSGSVVAEEPAGGSAHCIYQR